MKIMIPSEISIKNLNVIALNTDLFVFSKNFVTMNIVYQIKMGVIILKNNPLQC